MRFGGLVAIAMLTAALVGSSTASASVGAADATCEFGGAFWSPISPGWSFAADGGTCVIPGKGVRSVTMGGSGAPWVCLTGLTSGAIDIDDLTDVVNPYDVAVPLAHLTVHMAWAGGVAAIHGTFTGEGPWLGTSGLVSGSMYTDQAVSGCVWGSGATGTLVLSG